MITWKSKTLFNGLFPCPDYWVKQAIRNHEDLYCYYNGKESIVKEEDLKHPLKQSELYDDKFRMNGGKQYKLFYYKWNPKSRNTIDREMCGY
jgi:hypothetical protein